MTDKAEWERIRKCPEAQKVLADWEASLPAEAQAYCASERAKELRAAVSLVVVLSSLLFGAIMCLGFDWSAAWFFVPFGFLALCGAAGGGGDPPGGECGYYD